MFSILAVSQLIVFAQDSTEKTGCPVFSVDGPSSAEDFDKPLFFRANIDRKLSPNERIRWTTSAGKILSGQGTESITVENVSKTGMGITATVEIIGLPGGCQNSFSASAPTVCLLIPELITIKVDKFGKVTNKVLREKVGILSQELKEDPSATASIVKYIAKRTNKLDVYRNLQTILNHLKSDGIDEERINFQIPLENGEITEFWFVSAGAKMPLSDMKHESLDAKELNRKIAKLSEKQ